MPETGDASAGGFEAPEPAELTALLNGFEVHNLIACGGMGAVYSAEQLSLGREVAIKVLPRELAQDQTFCDSFEAEARAMAQLMHPNLIGVYDFGHIEGMLYLVMEFVAGDSLFAVSHDQVVDPHQAVAIVQGIASGLGHAHEHGIVHRDIKPANVLIGQDLVPKLGDFGLAVASDDVASGMVMGTPGYVAPEILHDSTSASPASDVFALGALLHSLLTGIIPDWDAPPDIDLVPNLGSLRHLVRKAVSLDPAMRFKDGTAMAKGLGEWLEKSKKGSLQLQTAGALPAAAFGSASAPPVEIPRNSGFGMLSVAGLVVMAIIGGGIWFAVKKPGDPPPVAGGPSAGSPAAPPAAPGTEEPEPEPEMEEPPAGGSETPPAPDPQMDPEAIREHYLTALGEAREAMIARRLENRQALEKEITMDQHWSAWLALVDDETQALPRHPGKDNSIRFSPPMLTIIGKYVMTSQERIDDEHYAAVEQLHRECLRELDKAGASPEREVARAWEEWVEWLGVSPLHVLGTNLIGKWEQQHEGSRDATIEIGSEGTVTIGLGGLEFSGTDLVTVSKDGAIAIARSPEDSSLRWDLRWRDDALVGKDERGTACEFFREDLGLANFRPAGAQADPRSAEMDPDAGQAQDPGFNDPELADLNTQYLTAVQKQIEPLASGYRKVLMGALAVAERRDDARSIEQISIEIARLDGIPWKTGRVDMESVDWESAIPLSHQGQKSKFDRAFREKMGKLQSTYLSQLKKLRSESLVKRKNTEEIDREIQRLELPPGTIPARYVKIQIEQGNEVSHTTVNEINIFGRDGEPIPQDSMSIHGVSSHQEARGENRARVPDHVLDGNPDTFWHSRWAPNHAPWPHWIAIDLGKEELVTGFSYLPRRNWQRNGDIVQWTLLTSLDGSEWREAATGRFPRSKDKQEFRIQP